jgi:ribonuclease P/MRP protein subunit POP1
MLPKELLLGYITTGDYCLSEGKSFGIGCCSVLGLLNLLKFQHEERQRMKAQFPNRKIPTILVLIRGITSRISRPAKLIIFSS